MTRNLALFSLTFGFAACAVIAQDAPRPQPPEGGAPKPHLLPRGAEQELNLTTEQRQGLAALEAETQTKLERLLTPAQMEKVKAMRPPSPPRGGEGRDARSPGLESSRSRGPEPRAAAVAATPHQPLSAVALATLKPLPAGVKRLPAVLSGGHETVPVDGGRPVVLIAAALGVKDEVFREAFSHVRPAGPGSNGPSEGEARANKQALMSRLAQHGITNDRLNTVSNFYRYASWQGGIWKNQPATANALVKDGAIIGFEITSSGYGYTTPPTVSVPDMDGVTAKVKLAYGKNMETNGSVAAITVAASN